MERAGAAIAGQLITLAVMWGYVYAFRAAFDGQAAALRARPKACLGWGFGLAAFWTALGLAAFHLAALNRSAWLLSLLTVPMFLASAAGGAVCLGVVASRLLRLDLAARPYLCVAIGQAAAVALGLLPYAGSLIVAVYACAGIGSIIVAERAAAKEAGQAPRLGYAGLACLLLLTAAISFGLVRGGRRMAQEARALPAAQP